LLCDPALANQFDALASRIAPGFSNFEYRWGALSLRKEASKAALRIKSVDGALRPRAFSLEEVHRLPDSAGHYIVSLAKRPFFVGYAKSLRQCALFAPERLSAAAEVMNATFHESGVSIKTRLFDPAKIKARWGEGTEVEWREAWRA